MLTPRLAVSALSYHQALANGRMALEDVPGAARELGFSAIEINDTFLRATSRIRQRAYDLVMQRYFGPGAFYRAYTSTRLLKLHAAFEEGRARLAAWTVHTDFTLTGRAARWQMNYLEGAIAAADDFGARLVCIQTGGSSQPTAEELERCIDGLQQSTALASQFHTRLALENGAGIATTAEQTLALIRKVDSPNLGVCLRFADEDSATLAPYAIHVHATSQAFDAQGRETRIDYPACMAALRAAQYQGWITIDFEGEGEPTQGIMQTAELIGALAA
jgi:sugar phosphate isomerase/epimerase